MDGKIDRRKLLGGVSSTLVAGTLGNMLPSLTHAADEPKYLESSLTPETLEKYKIRSAEQLVNGVWSNEALRTFALENFFKDARTPEAAREKLRRSSTMTIPAATELQELRTRSAYIKDKQKVSALDELALQTPNGQYGLYVDGDTQKLYLLANRGGAWEFVTSFLTSTSTKEYSNKLGSGGTPLGLHRIVFHRAGNLGQVFSDPKNFPRVSREVDGRLIHEHYVRSLQHGVDPPAIITDAFALWGPSTPLDRRVFVHGSNHETTLGKRYSGGCARMANVDAHLLAGTDEQGVRFIEVGTLNKSGTAAQGGTPVMIHASSASPKKMPPVEKEKVPVSPPTSSVDATRTEKAPPASLKPKPWDANPPQKPRPGDQLPPGLKDVTGK